MNTQIQNTDDWNAQQNNFWPQQQQLTNGLFHGGNF
jgi:hypothetical protein